MALWRVVRICKAPNRCAKLAAMYQIDVVGAAIIRDGMLLCALRPPGGPIGNMWEFAGGKVEPGETHHQALVREIDEELGVIVQPNALIARTTLPYPGRLITLTTYYCDLISGVPAATEHAELRWVPIADLLELDWAPLDVPAVEQIQKDWLCDVGLRVKARNDGSGKV